jgi:hypothetical protein
MQQIPDHRNVDSVLRREWRPRYAGRFDGWFISDDVRWKRFEREWRKILLEYGVTYFHMKEYAHSRGQFDGWEMGDPRRKSLMRRLTWVIKQNVMATVGRAVPVQDYEELVSPKLPKASQTPYFLCFHSCLSACCSTARLAV